MASTAYRVILDPLLFISNSSSESSIHVHVLLMAIDFYSSHLKILQMIVTMIAVERTMHTYLDVLQD